MTSGLIIESLSANGSEPHGGTPRPTPAPRRHRWWKVALLFGAATVVAVATLLYDPRNLFDDEHVASEVPRRDTATVSVSPLVEEYSADGTMVFHDPVWVTYQGRGSVVTSIVAAGDLVERGDVVWRVDNEPTVALYGDLPSYRGLSQGEEGLDVLQLENNLVALGYDPDGTVTVDEAYTANTALMVERWQEDVGASVNGRVLASSVVYVAGPGRIGGVDVHAGDVVQAGAPIMEITAMQREVTFGIPAAARDTLGVGDPVRLRMPDRSTMTATVVTASVGEGGGLIVEATPDEAVASSVDTIPVTVSWEVTLGDDARTVPASALIRTDSGRYHLEVVADDGTVGLVPVDIGESSGGTVEILSDISEGTTIVSP